MSIIRGAMVRRKSRGTLQERVSAGLKRLDSIRAQQEACAHRFVYSPSLRHELCIDCGLRSTVVVRP